MVRIEVRQAPIRANDAKRAARIDKEIRHVDDMDVRALQPMQHGGRRETRGPCPFRFDDGQSEAAADCFPAYAI